MTVIGVLLTFTFVAIFDKEKNVHVIVTTIPPVSATMEQKFEEMELDDFHLNVVNTDKPVSEDNILKDVIIPKQTTSCLRAAMSKGSNCVKQLPQVLHIGVPKCGTAALINFLRHHPNIATSQCEVSYFSNYFELGNEWYKAQQQCATPGQITVERSTGYFADFKVPKRVWEFNKSMKLLLSVCEPVRRTLSHFTMCKSNGPCKKNITAEEFFLENANGNELSSLNTDSKIMHTSNYSCHFESWLKYFPREQFHVIDGDKLTADPYNQLRGIERFLEIENFFTEENFVFNATKGFYCFKKSSQNELASKVGEDKDHEETTGVNCLPPSKGRPRPQISETLLKLMESHFKPYNTLFYNLAKRNFYW